MVALRKPPSRMTVAEFVAWHPGKDDGRWQLVDGEPVLMAPASETHGAIQGELAALLRNHLLERGSPCRVIVTPGVVPRVRANENVRIPDLGVTCAPPGSGYAVSDVVLLVEVLSPSNEAQTRTNVWAYTTIPGVGEILLVHSTRIGAELLRRGPDGLWPEGPALLGPEDRLVLDGVEGFEVPLVALYRTTPLAGG